MMRSIFALRIWDPASSRIRKKFFLKSEILFGSDSSADVRIPELKGLVARYDTQQNELHWIESGKSEVIPEGHLFQIGSFVFQWKVFHLFESPRKFITLGLLGVAGAAGLLLWASSDHLYLCSERVQKLASRDWAEFPELTDYYRLKEAFEGALKARDLARSKGELMSLVELVDSEGADTRCGHRKVIFEMQRDFFSALLIQKLKTGDLSGALETFKNFKEMNPEPVYLQKLLRPLLRLAKKIFYEGYRLEETDSDRGGELMDQAQGLCQALQLKDFCFNSETNP